ARSPWEPKGLMAYQLNNFDLKLLTSSKEVGLRRLRSYSASLGGGAQIFGTFEDLRNVLEKLGHKTAEKPTESIVLYDDSVGLAKEQLKEIEKRARLFVLQSPRGVERPLPESGHAFWSAES